MAIHKDEIAFLREITRNPDNDTPRLVFADWLEEQGDVRGEFIRIQCELDHLKQWNNPKRHYELKFREKALLEDNSKKWLRGSGGKNSRAKINKGLVGHIQGTPKAIAKLLPSLKSVTSLCFTNLEGIEKSSEIDWSQISQLKLQHDTFKYPRVQNHLEQLDSLGAFDNLRSLDVSRIYGYGDHWHYPFVRECLSSISLQIPFWLPDPETLDDLFSHPFQAITIDCRQLDFMSGQDVLDVIDRSQLTHLELFHDNHKDTFASLGTDFPRLKSLVLHKIKDVWINWICQGSGLHELESLTLNSSRDKLSSGIGFIAKSSQFLNLECLVLDSAQPDFDSLLQLFLSPSLPQLKCLRLPTMTLSGQQLIKLSLTPLAKQLNWLELFAIESDSDKEIQQFVNNSGWGEGSCRLLRSALYHED